MDCYDGNGGEAFFLVDRLGKFRRSRVSVNKVNYEGRVEESQDSLFRSCLLVSASAFRMTAWALCQSSLERVLVPAISLSLSGRFMPRRMTSEKLSPGSFALLRSWYTSSEMAMVLAMTSGRRDLLYMHSYTNSRDPNKLIIATG